MNHLRAGLLVASITAAMATAAPGSAWAQSAPGTSGATRPPATSASSRGTPARPAVAPVLDTERPPTSERSLENTVVDSRGQATVRSGARTFGTTLLIAGGSAAGVGGALLVGMLGLALLTPGLHGDASATPVTMGATGLVLLGAGGLVALVGGIVMATAPGPVTPSYASRWSVGAAPTPGGFNVDAAVRF